jgi:hypothetical protein
MPKHRRRVGRPRNIATNRHPGGQLVYEDAEPVPVMVAVRFDCYHIFSQTLRSIAVVGTPTEYQSWLNTAACSCATVRPGPSTTS